MYELFFNVKVIFLYRSVVDVVLLFICVYENVCFLIQGLEDNFDYYSRFFLLIKSYLDFIDFRDLNVVDFYLIFWLFVMECYLEFF